MADDADTLLTIAEIAATFAGFAALVSALGRRATSGRALHDLLRLRLVIATSLIVVVAALVPSALARFDLAEDTVWRIAALTFVLLTYAEIASFLMSYRPVREEFAPDVVAAGVAFVLQIVVQAALVTILVDAAIAYHDALYVTALVAMLCTAAFVFMRLVESTFRHISARDASASARPGAPSEVKSRREPGDSGDGAD
jgi:hypothetical protein